MEMERVAARFALFAGLGEEEARPWQGLWEASAQMLQSRLRRDADTPENAERLACAAAAAACQRYRALTAGGASSLRIGELAVSESPAQGQLEGLFGELVGDLMEPGVIFRQI